MEETDHYKLLLGDNISKINELVKEGVKVDLTVTSPPYDNLRTYEDSLRWDEEVWSNLIKGLYNITADGGVVVWVVGDAVIDGSETGSSFKQALKFMDQGFLLHDTMIYEKNGPSYPAHKKSTRYSQVFEYMFVFSKGKPKTANLLFDRKNTYGGESTRGTHSTRLASGELKKEKKYKINDYGARFNIWKYNTGKGFGTKDDIAFEHPAIFPDKLAEDHILTWSNPGDTVFDPFMGSGTTGKMSLKNDRKFIGTEIVPKYFDISKKRIKKEYNNLRYRENIKEEW